MPALQPPKPPAQAARPEGASIAVRIAELLTDAVEFVPPDRMSHSVRDWLGRVDASSLQPDQEALLVAEAVAMATTLAVFTPSASGTFAVDRLARSRRDMNPMDAATIQAMRDAQFRLLEIQGLDGASARLQDVTSGKVVQVRTTAIEASHAGLHLAAWLAPLPEGDHAFAGAVTPLDDAALAVAMGLSGPAGPGWSVLRAAPRRSTGMSYATARSVSRD